MIEEIKLLLGDAAANYSEAQINLALKMAISEVEEYCNRELDAALELVAEKIAVIKLNRINTEGLASQSYSGVSESYIDGYPQEILTVLNRKRKIKTILSGGAEMINTDIRTYNYFSIGDNNGYGQATIIKDENDNPVVQGSIKMAINITSQGVQDNINYKNAQYVGLTLGEVKDTNIIDYEGSKLKVLYVNPKGRYKQVFMSEL